MVYCVLAITFLLVYLVNYGQTPDFDIDYFNKSQPKVIRNALFLYDLDRKENVDNDQPNLTLPHLQMLKLNQTYNPLRTKIYAVNLEENVSVNAIDYRRMYVVLRSGFAYILPNNSTVIPHEDSRSSNNSNHNNKSTQRKRNSHQWSARKINDSADEKQQEGKKSKHTGNMNLNHEQKTDLIRKTVATASSNNGNTSSINTTQIARSIVTKNRKRNVVDMGRRRNGRSVVDINSRRKGNSVIDRNITTKRTASNNERHHLVFLKVHKAASTTVHNIVMRFALSRSLDVMLPRTGNILSETGYLISENRLHPYPPDLKFHVVCNHIIFNKTTISKNLKNPEETFFFGIVREPFSQFASAFYFYLNKYKRTTLVNIALDRPQHPIRGFLENSIKYSRTPDYDMSVSFINNRMAADFGFPMWNLGKDKHNIKLIKRFLKMTENEFHLVMVVDMFDESIVLLRRLLQWKVKDILYVKSNSLEYSQTIDARWKVNMNFTDEDRRLHKLYAPVDYALYNHFRNILLRKLKDQPPEFMEEVKEFKHILRIVDEFCDNKNVASVSELTVPGNRWTEEFKIIRSDCTLNYMSEMNLVKKAREVQKARCNKKA